MCNTTHHVGLTASPGRRAEMLAGWIKEHGSAKTGVIVEQVARYRAELAELLPTVTPADALGREILAVLGLLGFDSPDDLAAWGRIVESVEENSIRKAFRADWRKFPKERDKRLLGRILRGLDPMQEEIA